MQTSFFITKGKNKMPQFHINKYIFFILYLKTSSEYIPLHINIFINLLLKCQPCRAFLLLFHTVIAGFLFIRLDCNDTEGARTAITLGEGSNYVQLLPERLSYTNIYIQGGLDFDVCIPQLITVVLFLVFGYQT